MTEPDTAAVRPAGAGPADHPPGVSSGWAGAVPGASFSAGPGAYGAGAEDAAAGGLTLLPAVDVSGGRAVRLVQGAAGTETSYGDPLDAALAWQRAGAEWIHLVDLDAAFGRGSNAPLLAEMIGKLAAAAQPSGAAGRPGVAVELSGGIRDDAALAAALATGCQRVIIGTAALEDPDWVREVIARHGERIAVGLDVRGTRLAARGWTSDGGDLLDVLARLEADGCPRYVVTDVTKDGMLSGPNLDLLRRVCASTGRPVIASGGVSGLADLRAIAALRPLGVQGAIIGKALYAGAFTLEQALAAVRP
jgi:1-(5-phosphoribosyl)-5-[(5-phosphoribosylamino)methylideneamino] imidazole-4-carboxamide isomerase/N-(5'phosphoribosyl)anthranilate isomerase